MADKDEDIQVSNTRFLPIVSAYAARTCLVEDIPRSKFNDGTLGCPLADRRGCPWPYASSVPWLSLP
jgi:hypothetical protein